MEETKITLQQELPTPEMDALYLVDWSKVTSVNELMQIIASLGVSFSPHHPGWNMIKHLMDYTNPIKPNQPQQPKQESIQLPKLKSLK